MKKETVHMVSAMLWGVFGLVIGSLSVVYNNFNAFVMVTLVSAIAGNSVHLVSMSMSKSGISVSGTEASTQTKQG
jgi:hypothetical protein